MDTEGSGDGRTPQERVLVGPEPDETTVSWGVAEFVAAEEMDRVRGYWWAPDGTSLLVERYDEAPVPQWHIANPAQPDQPPVQVRYPAAGTGNADVSLWLVDLAGERREIRWDSAAYPYLVDVSWSSYGPPLLRVLSRDQKSAQVLTADLATGATTAIGEDSDPAWVEIVSGTPRWLPDGRLLTTVDTGETRQLAYDGEPVTPVGLQVGAVLDVDADGVLISATTEPTEQHVLRVGLDGTVTPLTRDPGVHLGRASGGTVLLVSQSLDHDGSVVRVLRGGAEAGRIQTRQEKPPFAPEVTLLPGPARAADRGPLPPRPHTGLAPAAAAAGPVRRTARPAGALGPGGVPRQPVARRPGVLRRRRGRARHPQPRAGLGTPGAQRLREHPRRPGGGGREITRRYPDDVDPGRVAMRGWSYGGYLSALAVIARPDVFHAGVAGAPVTDWRLYDTCYTERYLGHPDEQPEVYARNSLLAAAAGLERPLLLIHGLADDNVVAAHTLRLSSALLAAGRRHTVLPLTGVTHMTPQEVVAENLLLLELAFLREALG